MKWIGERISILDKKDTVSIVIYPEKIGWKLYAIGAWFVLWMLIGAYVVTQLFGNYEEKQMIVLFAFMLFWGYFALKVGRTFFTLLWGREFIKIDKTNLRLKKGIKTYGKTNQLFLENIAKMRLVEIKENSFQAAFENSEWVRGSNKIEFEYYGKVIGLGRKLNEKDAKLFYQFLTKRITQFIKKA